MNELTMQQLLLNKSQKLYVLKIEALKKWKEKTNEFWLKESQRVQVLGATEEQLAIVKRVHLDEIEKIEIEITETQTAFDSISY